MKGEPQKLVQVAGLVPFGSGLPGESHTNLWCMASLSLRSLDVPFYIQQGSAEVSRKIELVPWLLASFLLAGSSWSNASMLKCCAKRIVRSW